MKRSINDVEQDTAGLAGSARDPKRPRTEYNYEAVPKQFPKPMMKQPTKADTTVPAKDTLEGLVVHTAKELHTLISLEIDKQRELLCSRFYTSSLREFTQDMMDFWCREAQVFEDKTLAQWSLDTKDIESPRGMVLQMMKRQYEILQKAWHKQFPPPKDTRSFEYQHYREHAKRSILISQLQELRKWTARWQQRLRVEIDQPRAGSSRHRNDGLRQRPERSATSQHRLRNNQEHRNRQLPLPARDQNLPVQGGARPSRPSMARDRPQQRDCSRMFIDYCRRFSPPKTQHIRTPDLLTAQSDHLGQHTWKVQQPQEQDYQYGPWMSHANVPQSQPQYVGIDRRGALGAQVSRRQGQASAAASPLLIGPFNTYDHNQCPVDSRLPDLVLDHSDSYDFDLGIERETRPAMDTIGENQCCWA
ncbi:hypothetical protein EPUS_08743 [Endocarpon pusillum Z07020]|uniref:Uncharacterized protein n=1 Tax=Endocarpon pusillum (strain Z07020 / HMAS-L-300199) TaxID=1263415 RepID=U1G5J2_ENDPU|nr:uncharacterized protein EPUS_08743 [Endocarpon pusillum Z07020]ERF72607.1 hypothetical protein EPUS_08743 [Endocarpon pusillum Z07020]